MNVYSLDDAPAAWRRTVMQDLSDHGYCRPLLEPCWWLKHLSDKGLEIVILLEVDDFSIASASPEISQKVRSVLESAGSTGTYVPFRWITRAAG